MRTRSPEFSLQSLRTFEADPEWILSDLALQYHPVVISVSPEGGREEEVV